jgi:NADH dehydrogenase
MVATNGRTVTVFGGTGFLGRRIARHLRYREFTVRIASRHPDRGHRQFGPYDPQLQFVEANIHDERSVADALAGAYGVVNAVSLYLERGQETFHSVHVESAQRVAAQAHRAGVERLVHVSGIGADAASPFRYIRKRGEGELAVRAAFADALFVRPAVMFGPDDAFLTTILKLLRQLPIYPMFGRGRTRLQPAYAEDVAEAVARAMRRYDASCLRGRDDRPLLVAPCQLRRPYAFSKIQVLLPH